MNIFDCVDQQLGNNKAHITRLINDEVSGNIASTTISRIYENKAKESLTSLVKYALLNILTKDIMLNNDSTECITLEKDIYIECQNEPELERKLNEWHQNLDYETRIGYVSKYLASRVLDEYSGLERVVGVMISDFSHDNKYPQGYTPSFEIHVDTKAARFELIREELKEWLI